MWTSRGAKYFQAQRHHQGNENSIELSGQILRSCEQLALQTSKAWTIRDHAICIRCAELQSYQIFQRRSTETNIPQHGYMRT